MSATPPCNASNSFYIYKLFNSATPPCSASIDLDHDRPSLSFQHKIYIRGDIFMNGTFGPQMGEAFKFNYKHIHSHIFDANLLICGNWWWCPAHVLIFIMSPFPIRTYTGRTLTFLKLTFQIKTISFWVGFLNKRK